LDQEEHRSSGSGALARGLAQIDRRLQGLVAATPVVIFFAGVDGEVFHWSGSSGRPDPELLRQPAVRAAIDGALAGHVVVDAVEVGGATLALTLVPGPTGGAVAAVHELSALRDAGRRLAVDAFLDRLTGLATRAHFLDRADEALARARQGGITVAVVLVDLDRFAAVNESLGYAHGDRVLAAVGDRITTGQREEDIAARVGGDEFAVLYEGLGGRADAVAVAERIAQALEPPFVIEGRELYISASIGIGIDRGEDVAAEELLLDAAAAARKARERGRGRWAVFDQALRDAAVRRMETRTALYRALDRDELRLHYQPVVATATGAVVGVEALVRWEHPELGLVPPDQFVPVAEETGLIIPIGSWVLREACAQLADWRSRLPLPAGFRVSVNLSAAQLHEPGLPDEVAQILAVTGVGGAGLMLEITESMFLEHGEVLIAALGRLRALGVRIAIDDFGTGWSALGYLKRIPLDTLKVDRTFVSGLLDVRADRAIAEAVVGLATALDLSSVAEGVETAEQLQAVRALGCSAAQGFLFSRPLPPAHVEPLIVSRK
jgi:diguanylate cyclase (GGDEF)-like protein